MSRVKDLLGNVCILCHRVHHLHSFSISVMCRILVDAVLGLFPVLPQQST